MFAVATRSYSVARFNTAIPNWATFFSLAVKVNCFRNILPGTLKRCISLLSVPGKIYGRVLTKRLMQVTEKKVNDE